MLVIHDIPTAAAWSRTQKAAGHTLGFVPTMGALHEGHLSLVRASREACGATAVSIFVNPTQFGPGEDLDAYPRTLEADLALLEKEGTDMVFVPTAKTMYPAGHATQVRVSGITEVLCGASRPVHFGGVTTVVLKFFNILLPDQAFFGAKDYQQTLVVRKMVRDLDVPVTIRTCPTVREADGLAMSSRNRYLTPEERRQALALSQGLQLARELAGAGRGAAEILAAVRARIEAGPLARIDYLELRHPETLAAITGLDEGAVLAMAVFFGKTRLIDNTVLPPAGKTC